MIGDRSNNNYNKTAVSLTTAFYRYVGIHLNDIIPRSVSIQL